MSAASLPSKRGGIFQEASVHALIDQLDGKLDELKARLAALCVTPAEDVHFFEAKLLPADGLAEPSLTPLRCRRDLTCQSSTSNNDEQWSLVYVGEATAAVTEYTVKSVNVSKCSENVLEFCRHLGYSQRLSFVRKGVKYQYAALDICISITQILSDDGQSHVPPEAATMWLVEAATPINSTTRTRLQEFQRLLHPLVHLQKVNSRMLTLMR